MTATVTVTRLIGNAYSTSCSGVTTTGLSCKRRTFVLYNGDPFCPTHAEQATAARQDNIAPEQAEALYAEYGIA